MTHRIGIINRGEAAARCLAAIAELAEVGGRPLNAVLLFVEADARSSLVAGAPAAHCIGEGREAYLDPAMVVEGLRATGCTAAWLGWGFASESAAMVAALEAEGIIVLGPRAQTIERVGDKIAAKRLAESVGVPICPWFEIGPRHTVGDVLAACDGVRYPLLVKASAGGGGRGIRRVDRPNALAEAIETVRREAGASFGEGAIFVERLVTPARHVEVQIFGDGAGRVAVFGVRDCSTQRRRQKVVEECLAPHISEAVLARIELAAIALGEAVDYRSAGTVEFLYCPDSEEFFFMEINARLQVEHPITEEVYRIDLVRMQIELALAGHFPVRPVRPQGWAFEARVCAEDPAREFMPAPGRLVRFTPPSGPGVRVDTGFREGDVISPEFDSMIAKIIAWGPSRCAALRRLEKALAECVILVGGGTTNLSCLRAVCASPEFVAGRYDTGVIDRLPPPSSTVAGPATLAALLDMATTAKPGNEEPGYRTEALGGVDVFRVGPEDFFVVCERGWLRAQFEVQTPVRARLQVGGDVFDIRRVPGDDRYQVDGVIHQVVMSDAGAVTAPCEALVVAVPVQPGQWVDAGSAVAVVESMKMEVRLEAPQAGRVREVRARPGRAVNAGQVLVVLEGASDARVSGPLDELPWRAGATARREIEAILRGALSGWDDASGHLWLAPDAFPDEALPQLLEMFADAAELFERRPARERAPARKVAGVTVALTPRVWLETLGTRGPESLPLEIRALVARVARHFPPDEGAGFTDTAQRLRRLVHRLPRVAAHMCRLLGAAERVPLVLLDRLARLDPSRFADVALAASRSRWRIFEDPAHVALRDAAAATAAEVLAGLVEGSVDWSRLMALPVSLVPGLAAAAVAGSAVAAEAIARRLEWSDGARIRRVPSHGGPGHLFWLAGGAENDGCVVAVGRLEGLEELAQSTRRVFVGRRVLVTTLEGSADWPGITCQLAKLLAENDQASQGMSSARQSTTCLIGARVDEPSAPPRVCWFGERGEELRARRDILPTTWRRFGLERYAAFDFERVHGDDDITIFHARARSNGRDTRLLAFGEVRSLERSKSRPPHFPHVERVFHAALRAMHAVRPEVDPDGRGQHNAIMLYALPTVPLGIEAMKRYVERLAVEAKGLGIEKVVVRGHFEAYDGAAHALSMADLQVSALGQRALRLDVRPALDAAERPLGPRELSVAFCRRRGLVHPDDVVELLTSEALGQPGTFLEHELDHHGRLVPVSARPRAEDACGVVVGIAEAPWRDAVWRRVLIVSDPSRQLAAVAEPECRRICAALSLARSTNLPVEWVATSSGARIDFATGTENLDWVAEVLEHIIRFTQAGGEINVIAAGPCVGGQAYWIAEATMMMHTRGLLIMTDAATIVLTGKRALDASGCVSASDNLALGGFSGVMGPNGQAHLHATDLRDAYDQLFTYYANAGCGPLAPSTAPSRDPIGRDVGVAVYPEELQHGFNRVGEVFSDTLNPGRKRPFAIRPIMAALADADTISVEKWRAWQDAETIAVWETRIGGTSTTLIGIDNQPVVRQGRAEADGPSTLAGGTLYPQGARKLARALNAASGRRPVVVLANLSGFDGSPQSLRQWQLEYGSEIGRAVVNFRGRIVFVVLSRYHGGAYVVFSRRLNPDLVASAVEGSYASVIGGAPAARVVFGREVARLAQSRGGGEHEVDRAVTEIAERFDGIHTIQRALRVGSLDDIIDAAALRPYVSGRLRERPLPNGTTPPMHLPYAPQAPCAQGDR